MPNVMVALPNLGGARCTWTVQPHSQGGANVKGTRVCPANSISLSLVGLTWSLCIIVLNLVKIRRTVA